MKVIEIVPRSRMRLYDDLVATEAAVPDVAHARRGDGAGVVQGDAARGLQHRPGVATGGQGDDIAHGVQGHVVQEELVGAGVQGPAGLLNSRHLDFDAQVGDGLAGQANGVWYAGAPGAQGGQVVVLDEDALGQVEAMVGAAACTDGVLLQGAKAGNRLAGVAQAAEGTVQGADDGGGGGGEAAGGGKGGE